MAQSYTATALGEVKDPSGAVVPNARVTLKNESTGYTQSTTTDANGLWTIPNLPVGNYTVTVEHAGFATRELTHFTLSIGQRARLDVTLQLSTTRQSVTVTSAPPTVQTDSSSIGTVVPDRSIRDLPLNGRDYTQLAALTPGAVYGGYNGWSSSIQIDGNRADKTNFLIDGVPNTETWYGGALLSPSVDAIQEFRVYTNLAPAEYGQAAGIVSATTKSGTNQFHGDLYEFLRNDALDARNFFSPTVPSLKRNQFGGALGGPILKNKLFFYTDYEKTIQHQDSTTNVIVPTAQMRNGIFPASQPIIDPSTGQPFANNTIPKSDISPIANYYQQFIPLPNSGTDHFVANTPSPIDQQQFSVRVDKMGTRTNIMGRYVYGQFTHDNAFGGQIYGSANPLGNTIESVYTHNGTVDISHIFSPRLLLNVRLGFYHNYLYESSPSDNPPNRVAQSGIGGFAETMAGAGLNGGFPNIAISGYGGIPGGISLNIKPTQQVETLESSLDWTPGRHNIKGGFMGQLQIATDQNYLYSKGYFGITGAFTGNPYGDFLLGYPNYSDRSFPENEWGTRTHVYAFYLQDTWRIRPRLTLDLGTRFEFNPFPVPLRAGANFYPGLDKVVLSARNGKVDFWSQSAPFVYNANPSWFALSDQVGAPFALATSAGGHFDPRLGFAWRPFGGTKTVIRGGAGVFSVPWEGQITRGFAVVNPPWVEYEFKYASTPTDWATFWPSFTQPQSFTGTMVTSLDKKFYVGYSDQWNLTVEHELPGKIDLSVGYVGNKGTHLEQSANLEQPPYGPNAFSNLPYPQFGSFGQLLGAGGNSNYNALEIRAQKRFAKGLSFLTSYTWSKTMDYTSSDAAFISDRFHPGLDYGLSSLDTGDRLVTSWVYALPVGPGKHWGRGLSGVAGKMVGGWMVTGIASFQSGAPFSVYSTYDTSGFYVVSGQRADRVCNGKLSNPTVSEWYNTSCFTLATPYTIGSSARNVLRADAMSNFDIGILKDTHINEHQYVQFRFEMFNAFNHPLFGTPVTTIGLPTSGEVLTAGAPREIQLALKYYF